MLDKKYQVEIFEPDTKKVKINLSQLNDEMYLSKDKGEPKEAQFSFSIYKDNTKLKYSKNLKIKNKKSLLINDTNKRTLQCNTFTNNCFLRNVLSC